MPSPAAARELAWALPSDAERCSVAVPGRLAAARRGLAVLVSQSDPLPWGLTSEVLAYARVERASASGPRAILEIVRFASADRAALEADLTRVLARPLGWEDRPALPDGCAGESTCVPVRARFLDPHTVLLTQGEWGVAARNPSPCLSALEAHPTALEVSVRAAWLAGTELRGSQTRVEVAPGGLVRTVVKRYAGTGSAERALREAQRGQDELSVLAGVPSHALGARRGDRIEQTTFVSFDDLRFAREDRVRSAAAAARALEPPALAEVDARDPEAVRAAVDGHLRRLPQDAPAALLAPLAELLARARALAPEDDGLARRHYQLLLGALHDARGALALAEDAAQRELGDAQAWQLRKRAALARFDAGRLRAELRAAHGLAPEAASRMAGELARKASAAEADAGGSARAQTEDYERAEWAFLAAHQLGVEAKRLRRAPRALRTPLHELPRLLAYLGQSAGAGDLGLQVLVFGEPRPDAVEGQQSGSGRRLWLAETLGGGRPGTILAATTGDDEQLVALGRALALHTREGPLELVVGLERIGAPGRTTLVLSGRRRGAELALEQISRPLETLHWPAIERLLAAPLRLLAGAIYPPDELSLAAEDTREAGEVALAAQQEGRVRCAIDGRMVRCRGTLADQGAARRALLAVARARLASEGRSLWSGGD